MYDKVPKQLRVGIYERLSDEDKNKSNKEEMSESIKNQRHLLMEEIHKNPEFVFVDEYCDEDLSGAGTYRPEFERLIKDCENGKIDIVLCKSQSRFSRDMEIIEKYLHSKFIEWGVRFISLTDHADTENVGNKKARQINGLVNEWYLEDVSNNIRSAFQAKMKQGEFISPFAPFGYEISKLNNNKLIVDSVASLIVKKIFNLYLSGLGFIGIAKYLNQKKIPCPSLYKYQKGIKLNIISNQAREEIKWTSNAIKTILTNEVYLGHLVQGKRTTISYKNHKIKRKDKKEWIKVENTHEAIIEKETFHKVQMVMKERTKAGKKSGSIHLFSGKVFCLECNHYMRKKNSAKHEYLTCSKNDNGYQACINKPSMRYDLLADLVLEAINQKINKYYDDEELEKINSKTSIHQWKSQIQSLENQKKEVQDKLCKMKKYLKSIYEDKVNDIITVEQFKELNVNYKQTEKQYREQIDSINREINIYKLRAKTSQNRKKIFSKYQTFKNLNRMIIEEFIDKIYIGAINSDSNTRNIQIKWNW